MEYPKMKHRQSDGIAALLAIVIASRRAGDELGERVARKRLQQDYGVRIAFAAGPATNKNAEAVPHA